MRPITASTSLAERVLSACINKSMPITTDSCLMCPVPKAPRPRCWCQPCTGFIWPFRRAKATAAAAESCGSTFCRQLTDLGFEGISFLIRQFRDSGPQDPAEFNHGIDLKALAAKYVQEYARYKAGQKTSGNLDISKIPGVNHPVFKDRPVNTDPREVYVRSVFRERGEYNVFHDYYHALVQELFDAGVSKNVYCVNIDAVIAALLLKILWRPFTRGALSEQALETAAFTVFLYPRMVGCAAESDDHLNRGNRPS